MILGLRNKFRSFFLVVFILVTTVSTAEAIDRSSALTGDVRYSVQDTLQFRIREVPGGKIDIDSWVWRSKQGLEKVYGPLRADAVLRRESRAFGWREDLSDLRLDTDRKSGGSRHISYHQVFRGLSVFDTPIKVNIDRLGRVVSISSAYRPIRGDWGIRSDIRSDIRRDVRVSSQEAAIQSRMKLPAPAEGYSRSNGGQHSEPKLGIYLRGGEPVIAWKTIVWPTGEPAEYVVYLSAKDGHVLSARNHALRLKGSTRTNKADKQPSDRRAAGASNHKAETVTNYTLVDASSERLSVFRADGRGFAFVPDPLSKEGVSYSPPYIDNEDATNSELDAARTLVDLRDISTDGNGMFVLEGPFVRIVGTNNAGSMVYTPPAVATPDQFMFNRSESGFEAVNAYFHLDTSQRYVQSLGVVDVQNAPLSVNPQGLTRDESFFFPDLNMILFGTGGVDDAEDAGVLWHEYAHALLQAAAPGLLSSTEGVALHEGWSDYWATSYTRSLAESGQVFSPDWTRVFDWDSGEGNIWAGRVLDHTGHYPEDTCSDDPSPGASCSVHNDGRLWATVLMEVYTELGRSITDELNLRSHAFLSAPVTFRDAAQAMVQADLDNFSGQHVPVLLDKFGSRGLLDPNSFAPSIEHSPVRWSESNTGFLAVSADVVGVSSPVSDVIVHYQGSSSPAGEITLTSSGGARYDGQLPLPGFDDTISYYIEANDSGGRTSVLPEGAPTELFSVGIGPDIEAPSLVHEPLSNVALSTWPPTISATATDNLGVASVRVLFRIENLTGGLLASGDFDLVGNGDFYTAPFPVEANVLEPDARVSYRVLAMDAAVGANQTVLPANGDFAFSVSADGLFRHFDFESMIGTIQTTGDWEQGVPEFGLFTAHSGTRLVGTRLAGPYSSTPSRSELQLSPINLRGISDAMLIYWQWYDLEHDGTADPSESGAGLWDGANVKVSVDAGQTWSLLIPEGGYNGTIASARGNPMAGEAAFGGYSFGWRQVITPLPDGSDIRIRFDLGTDDDNTQSARYFAGWYLDDVSVTTRRPSDLGFPHATEVPDDFVALATADLPGIRLRATDDNGIRDAFADYEYVQPGGSTTGSFRLEMDPSDPRLFTGVVPLTGTPSPGDRITYRIRLSDYRGQTENLPSDPASTFVIEYRLFDTEDLTLSAVGSSLWTRSGTGWTVSPVTPVEETASLNLTPFDLADNAVDLTFQIRHLFNLESGTGGNVKMSSDGGTSWQILDPEDGYPGTIDVPASNPMNGERGFVGDNSDLHTTLFDLSTLGGKQVRIRLDVAADRSLSSSEFWVVADVQMLAATRAAAFEVSRELDLFAPYPNPFRTSTRIGFSIPDADLVEITLYDLMGRRVRTIVSQFYEPGTYEVSLGSGTLSGGSYVLRMRSGSRERHRMIALIR